MPTDNRLDLRELIHLLWTGKWLIGAVTLVATVIAVAIALLLPNIYRAEALLAPNDQNGIGGASALSAQYGGLASLAGIDIGGSRNDKSALGLVSLQSRKFLSDFVQRRGLLVPLMAATGWDPATGELKIDEGTYDTRSSEWVRQVKPPKSAKPSLQEAYEKISGILSVSQDSKTGFVIVGIEHYSPAVSQQWVTWLIDDLNSTFMRQDVQEAEQAIDYLEGQIAKTSLSDLQNVFFRLIEEQTKTVMLARVSPEYLFRTIDPAVVPERRAKPNRTLIVSLGIILGGLLGGLAVFVRAAFRASGH